MGQLAKPSRLIPAVATFGATEGFGFRPLVEEGLKALTPKLPAMPGVPDASKAPDAGDTAVQEAVAEGSRRRKLARGFKSTILSQFMPRDATALQQTIGA